MLEMRGNNFSFLDKKPRDRNGMEREYALAICSQIKLHNIGMYTYTFVCDMLYSFTYTLAQLSLITKPEYILINNVYFIHGISFHHASIRYGCFFVVLVWFISIVVLFMLIQQNFPMFATLTIAIYFDFSASDFFFSHIHTKSPQNPHTHTCT